MKGNISVGDKVFKMSSKELNIKSQNSINSEQRKILLNATVKIKKGKPLSICVTSANAFDLYKNLNLKCSLDILPIDAQNKPLNKETVIEKINKTRKHSI